MVRLIVLFGIDVLVGEDGLAIGLWVEVRPQVELIVGGAVVVVVQRVVLIAIGIEHGFDGGERRVVVGVTRETDEDH